MSVLNVCMYTFARRWVVYVIDEFYWHLKRSYDAHIGRLSASFLMMASSLDAICEVHLRLG